MTKVGQMVYNGHTELSEVEKMQVMVGECFDTTNDVNEFDSKKELIMKMHILATKHSFQFQVKKSMLKLYILQCIDPSLQVETSSYKKMSECNLFKVRKYPNVHNCCFEPLKHDHRQVKSWVVENLVQSKFMLSL